MGFLEGNYARLGRTVGSTGMSQRGRTPRSVARQGPWVLGARKPWKS
jgi:hypothetical protein